MDKIYKNETLSKNLKHAHGDHKRSIMTKSLQLLRENADDKNHGRNRSDGFSNLGKSQTKSQESQGSDSQTGLRT